MGFTNFNNQDYDELKQYCLSNGILFTDDCFPAESKSIYYSRLPETLSNVNITWKRPHELVHNPEYIVNGIDARDLYQGKIYDCWVISAIAAVADADSSHLNWVIGGNQTFDKSEGYCGIFLFQFWNFGNWYNVVIDDRLPVDQENKLIFCSNVKDPNEFWGPLLEKAYAKFSTCYEFIHRGAAEIAIVNMTGGLIELIDVPKNLKDRTREAFWRLLHSAHFMKSPCTAGLQINANDNGLEKAHAYSINKIVIIRSYQLKDNKGPIYLLKLRNPYGYKEWKGDWDDDSPKWDNLNDDVKDELKIIKDRKDGEFWMSFDDFTSNFTKVRIAHVNAKAFTGNNDAICPITKRIKWKYLEFHGKSVLNNVDSNDQFLISVKKAPESKVNPDGANLNSVIVSLMCEEDLGGKNRGKQAKAQIYVYRIDDENLIAAHKKDRSKFNSKELTDPIEKKEERISKEFGYRFNLKEGNYVIIGFIEFQNEACKYYIRILTETDMEITESCLLTDVGVHAPIANNPFHDDSSDKKGDDYFYKDKRSSNNVHGDNKGNNNVYGDIGGNSNVYGDNESFYGTDNNFYDNFDSR